MAHSVSLPHLVVVTLALILAAANPPDDVNAPSRYAEISAAQRAREEAGILTARDRAWVAQLRSSNAVEARHAFTSIVHAYTPSLTRFAYGLVKSVDVAEDMVQDIFIQVWTRRDTLVPESSLRGYLFTSVRRAGLNVLKRRAVEMRYATAVVHDISPQASVVVEDQLDADAIARAVSAALERLPERRRTALHLRYEEQLPFAVIAEVMGLSEKAVHHLVKRAVEELRGSLGL